MYEPCNTMKHIAKDKAECNYRDFAMSRCRVCTGTSICNKSTNYIVIPWTRVFRLTNKHILSFWLKMMHSVTANCLSCLKYPSHELNQHSCFHASQSHFRFSTAKRVFRGNSHTTLALTIFTIIMY